MQFSDVRQHLNDLFQLTKSALDSERSAMLQAVKLIGELHASNPWVNLGINESEFMMSLGISRDRYYSRVRAARALCWFPEVERSFLGGKVALSTIGMIESKLTPCNVETVLKNIEGKTKRETALFMSKITVDGQILDRPGMVEISMTLTEDELVTFNRLREVLCARGNNPKNSEVLIRAVRDSLEKRDPVRKAQRAEERQRKKDDLSDPSDTSNQRIAVVVPVQQDREWKVDLHMGGGYESGQQSIESMMAEQTLGIVEPVQQSIGLKKSGIPAMVRHQVWLRDRGQCTHVLSNGSRCEERAHLELDHIQMRCRGGDNDVGNLQLVCRRHNQFRAESLLGVAYMLDRRKSCEVNV